MKGDCTYVQTVTMRDGATEREDSSPCVTLVTWQQVMVRDRTQHSTVKLTLAFSISHTSHHALGTYLQGSELSKYFPKTALMESTVQDLTFFHTDTVMQTQKTTSSPRNYVLETDSAEKKITQTLSSTTWLCKFLLKPKSKAFLK